MLVHNICIRMVSDNLSGWCLLLHLRENITDVVPWVPVQALLEPLLIKEVTDEANTATEDKQTIESSVLNYVLRFIFGEEVTETFEIEDIPLYDK